MDIFLQQIINGLTLGSIYAIVALGYTMVYGIIQLINFAHGEVVMIGALVALTVISWLAANTALPPLVIVLTGTGAAIPVCMLVGYALERLAYRRLAPCAAAGTADHRDRRFDRAAAVRHDDLEPQSARVPADYPEPGISDSARRPSPSCRSRSSRRRSS